MRPPSNEEYESIARLCHALRRFVKFSEQAARSAGLTHQQLQALIAVRGYPGRDYLTVGELAEKLQIKHHSTVELVNRLEAAGLVRRQLSEGDRRRVRVYLTQQALETLGLACAMRAGECIELGRELHRELGSLIDP
jgi:DNA-binding MarR family transcriptional regulator